MYLSLHITTDHSPPLQRLIRPSLIVYLGPPSKYIHLYSFLGQTAQCLFHVQWGEYSNFSHSLDVEVAGFINCQPTVFYLNARLNLKTEESVNAWKIWYRYENNQSSCVLINLAILLQSKIIKKPSEFYSNPSHN